MLPLASLLALSATVPCIGEILPDPPDGAPEFVEVHASPGAMLGGWSLDDGASRHPLPAGAAPGGGGVLVISSDCQKLRSHWLTTSIPCLSPSGWSRLSTESDRLYLRDSAGRIADSVAWDGKVWGDWPSHRSLERKSCDLPGNDPESWLPSASESGATPGWIAATPISSGDLVLEIPNHAVVPGRLCTWRLGSPERVAVLVEIFDLSRHRMGIVWNGPAPARGDLDWDGGISGRFLSPGVYVVRASGGGRAVRRWIAVGKP